MQLRHPSGLLITLCTALLLAFAVPAYAGWSADGVAVRATTSPVPAIAVTSDGGIPGVSGAGAYVVWQEETGGGSGVMRVQHLLVTGDLDPAWPAVGVVACAVSAKRIDVGLVADGAHGCYVWWLEGAGSPVAIYAHRVLPDGTLDSRWPARGRQIGSTPSMWRPSVIADGSGGLFVAWSVAQISPPGGASVYVARLGPAGGAPAGWSGFARAVGAAPDVQFSPSLAAAGDGGVYCVWADWSADTEDHASSFRAMRLSSSGLPSPGWTVGGIEIGAFHPEQLPALDIPVTSCASDLAGGFYATLTDATAGEGYAQFNTRLQRRSPDGTPAAGWTAEGTQTGSAFALRRELAPAVVSDGIGGAVVSTVWTGTDAPPACGLARYGSNGIGSWTRWLGEGTAATLAGDPTGGAHAVAVLPCWSMGYPYVAADPLVTILGVSPAEPPQDHAARIEGPSTPYACAFGDVAITPTGDGGAIACWVSTYGEPGVFALRLNGGGVVTGVAGQDPAPRALELTGARYVPGTGIVVRCALPVGGAANLEVYDVTGRRRTSEVVATSGHERDVLLGDTAELGSGVYFVRLTRGAQSARARVLVSR